MQYQKIRRTIQKEFEMTYFIAPNPYQIAQRWARMAGYEPSRDLSLAVDVREEDNAYILNALVPGLKAADLNVQVLEDVVTISGEFKDDESEDANAEYLMRELPYGSFSRSLRMPVTLDAGKAEAKITDGVLTLRLAKAESALPKTIKVAVK
jgi:HSP20 family protein